MSRMRSIPVAPNSGFGGRDKGIASGSSSSLVVGSLADKFLGTSLGGSSPSPTAYSPLDAEPEDALELKEEDVWDAEDQLDKADEGGFVAGPGSGRGFGAGRGYGGRGRGHVAAPSATYLEAGDPLRYLGNGHHYAQGSKPKPRSAIPIGGVSLAMASAGRLNKQKQHALQQEDGVGSSFPDTGTANQSAPVNVPDWSKIYRLEKKPKPVVYSSDEEEDDGTGRKHRLHPHEIVARDYARSHAHVVSFSMCEGIGRTLKGRDLREVRNAVLRRTGFLE